ncbi:hypothetical protein [Ferruginibacter sp. SUN106]|uniref:hypothetical protein n=1 Tax=Ferruginibacter sp. SUN106 TaxID=2978348 RepID=UPI003D35E1C2
MKFFFKTQKEQYYTKKLILFIVFYITVIKAEAQTSGLFIGTTSGYKIFNPDGSLNFKGGITSAIAALRVQIIKPRVDKKITSPVDPKVQISETNIDSVVTNKDEIKAVSQQAVAAPVTRTLSTIYDIPGNTSVNQYTSLQANFQFLFFDPSQRIRTPSNPAGVIELYKLEKGSNTRTFCIPSGNCSSVNIPIQITENGQPVVAGAGINGATAGAGVGKPPIYMVVIPNGGYLQPGEYAFIDKSSLKPDGSALVCFTFTVR